MTKKNSVFIATSLDGFIADKTGSIDWLNSIPNPTNNDMGYHAFISQMDAIIMGRTTYETVCGFDIDWPYEIPVFVLSNSLAEVSEAHTGKVEIVHGNLSEILNKIHKKGHYNLYIDGGRTIQSFLEEDLIDEMTITLIPYLLGGGISLFGNLGRRLDFKCIASNIYLNQVVQNQFVRTRSKE